MSLKNEIEAYEKAEVSLDTGEIELWDHVVFPNVIRKRQIRLILDVLEQTRPRRILDFGCGAGWLSKILSSKGYDVTGLDACHSLISSARKSCREGHFVVGDCLNLPFVNEAFDCIIGIAILHHLDVPQALAECRRVASSDGTLLLMEPNELNPIAALGRKVIRLQTRDEQPFPPGSLKKELSSAGWHTNRFHCLFPYSFALSYMFKTLGIGDMQWLKHMCPLVEASEKIFEKLPGLGLLSYEIVAVATKSNKWKEGETKA